MRGSGILGDRTGGSVSGPAPARWVTRRAGVGLGRGLRRGRWVGRRGRAKLEPGVRCSGRIGPRIPSWDRTSMGGTRGLGAMRLATQRRSAEGTWLVMPDTADVDKTVWGV